MAEHAADHAPEAAAEEAPALAPGGPQAPTALFARGPTPAAILALQRTAGNAAVTRALRIARSPATDAISGRTSWIGDLDENALGRDLLEATLQGRYDFVDAVMNELGTTDRDDVAFGFMTAATDGQLATIAASATGRRVLDRMFDELTAGSVDPDEQHQADRVLRVRARRIAPDRFQAAVQNAKIFPYRLPGITVMNDALIMAERRPNNRIWVKQPTRTLGMSVYREETRTLPVDVFIGGIELPEDEIVGVRMYDLGGGIVYRPALFLVQLANETDTTSLTKVVEIAGLGLTLGVGTVGALGVRAGLAARVLLMADRVALVLGTAASILHEHRGEIISAFPNNGPRMVRALEMIQSATAIYGFARVAVELPQLVNGLRRAYVGWQTERAVAQGLSSAERDAALAIDGAVNETLENAESINAAREPHSVDAAAAPPTTETPTPAPTPEGTPAPTPTPGAGGAATPQGFDARGRITRAGNRAVYDQGPAPTCGPVSCGMVMDTSGQPVDLARICQGVGPQGTYAEDLVALLRRNRVVSEARTGVTIADIRAATRGGNPVIVMVRNTSGTRTSEVLHWVVVDGVTTRLGQEVLAIRDPWGIQYFELTSVFGPRFTGQAVVTLHTY